MYACQINYFIYVLYSFKYMVSRSPSCFSVVSLNFALLAEPFERDGKSFLTN